MSGQVLIGLDVLDRLERRLAGAEAEAGRCHCIVANAEAAVYAAEQRLAAAEAREKYLERQCDTYMGERQHIRAAIPAELLKEDLTLAENVAFIVSQLSKENPVNDKDPAVCGLCGLPMPPGEEMFNYHGYSGPCPGPPKIMSVEEMNASCDVSGHILLPEASQCGICGVQAADMVRITRSVWEAIRKQLDDTKDALEDLRQTHRGILAMIGTGDEPTYDELVQWMQAAVTALAVGDICSGSPLHHKLRDVMIAYRAAKGGRDE